MYLCVFVLSVYICFLFVVPRPDDVGAARAGPERSSLCAHVDRGQNEEADMADQNLNGVAMATSVSPVDIARHHFHGFLVLFHHDMDLRAHVNTVRREGGPS